MSDCTVWERATQSQGYGMTWFNNRLILVHRLAWILFNGPIPNGLFVLHRCDNRPCYKIEHLFLGTHLENIADAIAKGRWNKTPPPPRPGEKHHAAKLNDQAVRVIRYFGARGISSRRLAELHGVVPSAINGILRRRRWKHIV